MVNVTIIVKGIAICFSKGNVWKVVFPFNQNEHRVKLSGPGMPAVELALADRQIDIIGTLQSQFGMNAGAFDEFIDLTGSYAHGALKHGTHNGVVLSIPDAHFAIDESTHCRYELMEGTRQVFGPKRIGYSVRFSITGTEIGIKVKPGDPRVPAVINQDCTLTFDNTCPGRYTEDNADFSMVYDVIEDDGQPGRRFRMRRYFWDKPWLVISAVLNVISLIRGGGILKPMDNPYWWEAGLPCNVVVASKSRNLP